MRVPKFDISNNRSIRFAQCAQVPPLMVIAGPNGCGKSTLLNAIRTGHGYQNIMYVGPHRAMRRQQVQQRHLLVAPISFESLLTGQNVPGFEGIRLLDGARDPWGYDDSANYLKHALCQIEVERQQAIAARFDKDGQIERGALVDPWEPLKTLTHNLLPHLSFDKIDATNRNQLQCAWKVHGSDVLVDLDDLSSGEKSIIQMFYPLVEREIKHLLAGIGAGQEPGARPELCVLIDEPELHLHPNLQLKVLDYLRVLTTGTQTQVVVATHSPTIVEYASFEELFLLRPVELVKQDENQLIRVANDDERLRILREVFGNTMNLTAMQSIIVVEGTSETDASNVMPDRKLYRALHSGFDSVTVIPGGGKHECKALVRALNDNLKVFSPHLQAIALLDRDMVAGTEDKLIRLLPVAMIENLLLDPDSIWEAIQSVIEKTKIATVDDVSALLAEILDALHSDEAGRRAGALLGSAHFHPTLPATDIPKQAETFIAEVNKRYSIEAVTAAITQSREKVEALRRENRRREEFHGKAVLNEFYRRHIASAGLPKVVFTFEAARHARRRKSVVSYFDALFSEILTK
jgi:ABC-type hemin transport system ATPase subunit